MKEWNRCGPRCKELGVMNKNLLKALLFTSLDLSTAAMASGDNVIAGLGLIALPRAIVLAIGAISKVSMTIVKPITKPQSLL
jgi:hypothetical protein